MKTYIPFLVEILPILVGMMVLSYAVYLSLLLYKKIPQIQLKKAWLFQTTLTAFFCIGYLAAIILNASQHTRFLPIVISFVFFFGSVYVVTLISITSVLTQDLIKFNEELEEKIKLRTHQLEQSLIDLKKTQEQLLLSKTLSNYSDIAGQIAHEFNTPICSIQLIVDQLLNENQLPDGATKKIHSIYKIAAQLERVTGSFRRLFWVGNDPLKEDEVLFSEILESLVVFMGEQLARNGIELKKSITISPEKKTSLCISYFAQVSISLIANLISESHHLKERSLEILCHEESEAIQVVFVIASDNPSSEAKMADQPFSNFVSLYKPLKINFSKRLLKSGVEITLTFPN
ncbi:MAG: hypothetical protein B7Y39_19060 [Bdellovibrio sp. 28-41-41]|nr:MAG: hypothetical protein B7Y39_19060 [Bdellovibrio sp. 28-41-41]